MPLHLVKDAEDDLSDAALAGALKAGRADAPAQAWARFAPLVYGTLARVLGSDDEVDDLTQEVFIRLFRRVHTLSDPTALRSFVYSITVRVIRGEMRRRWVRRIMRPADVSRLPDAAQPQSAEDPARDAIAHLYRVLDQLKPRDRTIFVLRHIEGLSLEETAAAVGLSLATVKRRLAHAGPRVDHHVKKDPVLRAYLAPGRSDPP